MDNNNIELRSEKVRNLIGVIPSKTVNYGITIISLILCMVILLLLYMPYPRNLESECYVDKNGSGKFFFESYIPYEYINVVQIGLITQIEIEGFQHQNYGYIEASISSINNDVIEKNGVNYFRIRVSPSSNNVTLLKKGMKGTMFIRINNSSVLGYIIKSNNKMK